MMRFIDGKYNADKEKYYKAAKKNNRFTSRFITGNRLPIRMNAIKALGVIELAKTDEQLDREMFEAAGRAFKQVRNSFEFQKNGECKFALFEDMLATMGIDGTASDDRLHDTIALYRYFCEKYQMGEDTNSVFYQEIIPVVEGKEQAYMYSYGEVGRDFIKKFPIDDQTKELIERTIENCGGKTLAEIGRNLDPAGPEFGFYQVLWDFTQLDNMTASIYENEKFSNKEIQEIFNSMIINIEKGMSDTKDFNKYYIVAMYMRSLARMYHEAEAVVDQYAGIVRESEANKEMVRDNAKMASKISELEKLAKDRQDKLNALQLEHDREKKKNRELAEELAMKDDQIKILQNLLQENEARSPEPDEDEATKAKKLELAKNKKAVVFGGPPNWQNEVKKKAPAFNMIATDNYNFEPKIIDKADVIIMKTDYMAHAQWYKVIERARKLKKNVVFFSGNNIDELLMKIGE